MRSWIRAQAFVVVLATLGLVPEADAATVDIQYFITGGRTDLLGSSRGLESADPARIYGGMFTLSFPVLGESSLTLASGPAMLKTFSAFASLKTGTYGYGATIEIWMTLNLASPVAGIGTISGLFENSQSARLNGLGRLRCSHVLAGHPCVLAQGVTTGRLVPFGVVKVVPPGSGAVQASTDFTLFSPGTATAVLKSGFSTTTFAGQELNRTYNAPEPGATPLLLTAAGLTMLGAALRRRRSH